MATPSNRGMDFIGKRFGRLVVQSIVRRNTQGAPVYLCRCDCGGTATPGRQNLTAGESKSCGCLRREVTAVKSRKHGMEGTRVYRIWKNMMVRCSNPNATHYKDYGGRGISVCDRWREFAGFFSDMGQPPSDKHSIDRIDVNGNYEPGNCRWATPKEQASNKRNVAPITAFGRTALPTEWAKETGISSARIRSRIYRGWSPEDALSVPVTRERNRRSSQ